jgi:DNA polymerase III delta prime subunit
MLLKITLVIAILAGLATAGLNFFQVKEKINTTIAQRDQNAKDRDQERSDKVKAQKLAKETQVTLDKTKAELATTKDERDKAVAEATEITKRAEVVAETLRKAQQDRDLAQNDLAAWRALGIPIEHIKATLASLRTVSEERDAIAEEKKILFANNVKLQNKLNSILDPDFEPQLPLGLKGKVLVADPKYDFVVLNIGEKQGVLEEGRLLVNRNGKLIAKLKVKSVQTDRCIANVMPGWKLSDVMEGDQVLY